MGDYITSVVESLQTGIRDPYSLSVMIISWTVGVPIIVLSVFLIITLIGPGQLPKSIRIVLISIQAAVIVFAAIGLIGATLFLVQYDCFRELLARTNSLANQLRHSNNYININGTIHISIYIQNQIKELEGFLFKCVSHSSNITLSYYTLVLYGYSTMVSIRLVFMALYGVLVYIYIRYVFYKIKNWAVVISCVAVWIIFILINTPIVGLYVPFQDVLTNVIIAECLGFVIPLVVAVPAIILSIVLPIRALFFINKCTSKVRNVSYGKAITKLVLLQLIVNITSIIGHIIVFIPIIVYTKAFSMQQKFNDPWVATLIGCLLEMTSLLVSPILFIIFLKHVRENAKKIFNCKCFNSKGSSSS